MPDSLPRALCWSAAWDMTRDGELPAREWVQLVLAGVDAESEISVVQSLLARVQSALAAYADPALGADRLGRCWATTRWPRCDGAEPGSDAAAAVVAHAGQRRPQRRARRRAARAARRVTGRSRAWRSTPTRAGRSCTGWSRSARPATRRSTPRPSGTPRRPGRGARPPPGRCGPPRSRRRRPGSGRSPTSRSQRRARGDGRRASGTPPSGELTAPYVERYFADIRGAVGPAAGRDREEHRRVPVPEGRRASRRSPPPTPSWPPTTSPRRCAGWSARAGTASPARCGPGSGTPPPAS